MIYDTLPTENLKYSDIRDCLNSAGGIVNNDVASAFKESAKINKWAKYKPVAYPQPFTDNYPNWWKGFNGLCGISNFGLSDVKLILSYYKEGNFWLYTPPKGGAQEPFRLGDFRGYSSKKTAIMKSPFSNNNAINIEYESSSVEYEMTFTVEHRINNTNLLQLKDFDGTYDLSESKLCAFTFSTNPMNNIDLTPNNTFIGDAVKDNSLCKVKVRLNPLNDNYVVLGLTYETYTDVYVCLPIDLSESGFMSAIEWTYIPPFGIYISYNQIGFNGESTDIDLQEISNFTESNPYKIEERGSMRFLLNVRNVKNKNVNYDANSLYWDWDVSTIKSKLNITKFNGNNVSGQSYITIPANFSESDSMECDFSGLIYEISSMKSGWHDLNLYIKKSSEYIKIQSIRIYIKVV